MASQVDIANRALQKIGAGPITSLSDDLKAARTLAAAYPIIRDFVLRDAPWNFATRRAKLQPLSDAPSWGYATAYQLPADCLRLVMVADLAEKVVADQWKVEGRKILSDQTGELRIIYITSDVAEGEFDALFVEAFAARLAAEVCEELTQNATKRQLQEANYQDLIMRAKMVASQENSPDDLYAESWLNSRNANYP